MSFEIAGSRATTIAYRIGCSPDSVAQRAAKTPDVIRRDYDKPDSHEGLERRREQTQELDVTGHLHPGDLPDEVGGGG